MNEENKANMTLANLLETIIHVDHEILMYIAIKTCFSFQNQTIIQAGLDSGLFLCLTCYSYFLKFPDETSNLTYTFNESFDTLDHFFDDFSFLSTM
jgi:hypothetical protein